MIDVVQRLGAAEWCGAGYGHWLESRRDNGEAKIPLPFLK
jgi:hypothetical protein